MFRLEYFVDIFSWKPHVNNSTFIGRHSFFSVGGAVLLKPKAQYEAGQKQTGSKSEPNRK